MLLIEFQCKGLRFVSIDLWIVDYFVRLQLIFKGLTSKSSMKGLKIFHNLLVNLKELVVRFIFLLDIIFGITVFLSWIRIILCWTNICIVKLILRWLISFELRIKLSSTNNSTTQSNCTRRCERNFKSKPNCTRCCVVRLNCWD